MDPAPSTPPIVTSTDPSIPVGSIIKFDSTKSKVLLIPLQIRDEDTTEELKVRWRLRVGSTPPPANCPDPEPTLPVNGELNRFWPISINNTLIPAGTCSRLEVSVSSSFFSCIRRPDLFDQPADDENDLGRAYFWIWEVSNDTLTNPSKQQALLATCATTEYGTPTMMAP